MAFAGMVCPVCSFPLSSSSLLCLLCTVTYLPGLVDSAILAVCPFLQQLLDWRKFQDPFRRSFAVVGEAIVVLAAQHIMNTQSNNNNSMDQTYSSDGLICRAIFCVEPVELKCIHWNCCWVTLVHYVWAEEVL